MKRRSFIAAGLAAAAAPALAKGAPGDTIRLANEVWAVEIDPHTLAITVTPAGAKPVVVARDFVRHVVIEQEVDPQGVSWRWETGHRITCALKGADFEFRLESGAPGTIPLINQPPEAMGKGLILPITEGYYIAADDAGWRAALDGDERSTNEDLSQPLWGMDHGDFTLHWLMRNPFNNSLTFAAEGTALGLKLSHQFTEISFANPVEMTLHLGGPDLLAGAKRYRRHLIERGEFRSLADKIAATPSAEKLIGATHLYLWDNGPIGVKDVRDWPGFVTRLRTGTGLPEEMRAVMDHEALELVRTAPLKPEAWQQRPLIAAFNAALTDLARKLWQNEEADPTAIEMAYVLRMTGVTLAFGDVLTPDPDTWGASLTAPTFAKLKSAGLDRLWIGLGDGWEGGLWHPEATRAAVAQGYLIAPYDSYETAIPPGERPDWATAQLGRKAYDECGVVKADGSITAGFQRTGHYTNTRCVTPILKDRIPAIAKAAGFNSWFLDVYATGMVFDDYRPGKTMTMAQNSAANVTAMRWVSEVQQLPLGSEGGDAINAAGTIFAHGMETAGFGWRDADLRKNAASPFYLGNWFPPEAPNVFFKPVPLKEPYRTLYFDPRTRLPLYQAVFHDAVIVTHHWSFDQLKLSNVATERALHQQLFNVPPLFHVSAATLPARLPAMRRHDAFFRPLHQRLAHQALTGFDWLSDDRMLQRTRFADGTTLIANFADAPRTHEGFTLPPHSVTALIDGKPSHLFQN